MREATPHRSNMHTDMSTENRGSILAWETRATAAGLRATRADPGRNAFLEPEDIVLGPNGRVGGGDPDNVEGFDGDFEGEIHQ